MALTYDQSAQLMMDVTFRGRVKTACLTFARYIANEAPTTAGHASRWQWARNTILNPEQAAAQAQPPTVMDAAVQQDGSNVTDANLQSAVENVINSIL